MVALESTSRISAIAQLIPERETVWDVCCDHGLIGIKALTERKATQVKFVDVAEHLVANVREKFNGKSLGQYRDIVEFISADARSLAFQFSGTVVIAGVGARLIREILENYALSESKAVQHFLLCPHKGNAEQLFWSSALPGIAFAEEAFEIFERSRKRTVYRLNLRI